MAFPPGLSPKTVTIGIGSFYNGDLVTGRATITAPVNVVHTPSNRPIFSGEMSRVFVDGEASWNLVPTDAPGLNRFDWTYKLKVEVSGALVQPDPIYFTLPTNGPDTVDLDSLVTVPSSAGVPVAVDVLTAQDFGPSLLAELNNSTSPTTVALRAAFVPRWSANTAYDSGDIVLSPAGQLVQAKSAFTSASSFNGSNWNTLSGATPPPALTIAATVTATGALVGGKHNPVDAAAGALAMTLPTGSTPGTLLSVEKADGSTNTVTFTGSVRGAAGATLTLAYQRETILLAADAAGSWWPVAGHRTKASLDAAYVNTGELVINALDYGLSTAGTATANTTAIHAALAAGVVVFIPAGSYAVNALTIPVGQVLYGEHSRSYTGTPTSGTRLVCSTAAQTAPVVTLSDKSCLMTLAVIGAGAGAQHAGVAATSGLLRNVTISGCLDGIGQIYSGGQVEGCQIHSNARDGIRNIIDSQVRGCSINANTGMGINLSTGANDNIITDNKLEWNDGAGVGMFQTRHNVIANNIIDRNGAAGISATGNTNLLIADNVLRRNGRNSSGTQNSDTHFYMQDNDRATITGNTTRHGLNDDSTTGYDSPARTIVEQGGTNTLWVANQLDGCTNAAPRVTVTVGSNVLYAGNGGLAELQNLPRHRVRSDSASLGGIVPTTGTATGTLLLDGAVGTFIVGKVYRLILNSRRTDTGGRSAAELPIIVSREGGNASVSLGAINNLVATSFALTGGTVMNVAVTVATDGSSLSVTVSNVSANTYQVELAVIAL